MTAAFWVNTSELDSEQKQAVEGISDTASFLLRGPAGSGKTNILLLRAKYLSLKKITDFKIVVFTSGLKKFLMAGCSHYGINPDSVVTQMRFFKEILDEYGVAFESTKEFELDRNMLAGKVMSLIEEGKISDDYCAALLVDESQDYSDTELLVFRRLTKRLILASDLRQSIYKITHTPGLPERLVDNNVVTLKFHYRSGYHLCKVADAVLKDSAAYASLAGESRYAEHTRPSTVITAKCSSPADQITQILANLRNQIDLYPDERIGVLFPKKEQAAEFMGHLTASGIELADDTVHVDTLHGAKGWEFRAVHIGGCELLPRMGAVQKRLIYTGILRGKTSAHLYYNGHLPGYLEAAISVLEPPAANPGLDDLFRST